jgi:hypothetical protein
MNRKPLVMILALAAAALLLWPSASAAQAKKAPASLKASVIQQLGADTLITIEYSRPGVKGRKIWGDLVPWGLAPGNKYSKDKPFPWRAGANQNTTFEISKDVMVEGQKLAAGKYGVHMIPGEKEWIIIFSKNNKSWGSFAYNQEEDALRVTVVPVKAAHEEWLAYGFDDLAGTSATAFLHWEQVKVPIKIKIAE